MQFKLEISLDNDEAAQSELDTILPTYLAQVSQKVATGGLSGGVKDGNGNQIGNWWFEEDES
jgi:hypothetical protein